MQFAPIFLGNEPENADDQAVDDDTKLLVPVSVPVPVHAPRPSTSGVRSKRNTDKTLYLCSEKAKYCPLCRKRYAKRMVNHMKTQHPNSEVFVSRISPRMVDFIAPENENERKFIKYVKHAELLHAMCIFCEDEKSFSPHYWIDHVRSHTGEYGNACELCGKICSFSSHCNVPTTKIDNFNLRDEHMIAYRCNECNYVQTIPENIRTHLANQHDLYDEDERNFQVFTLLPAFRSLPKQNNPHEQPQIQGKRNRFFFHSSSINLCDNNQLLWSFSKYATCISFIYYLFAIFRSSTKIRLHKKILHPLSKEFMAEELSNASDVNFSVIFRCFLSSFSKIQYL